MPYHPMKLDGVVLDSVSPSGGQLALAFDRGRLPVIVPYSEKVLDSYDNVLSGDDATVEKDLKPAKTKEERQKPRAPRTFIGIDPTNEVVVIAVADGRSRRSTGVGFTEECALLLPFGCEKVMNLDGGGSSAMVLRDKEDPSKVHVVNNPSDGIERRVCDALLLLEKTPDAHSGPPSK